MSLPIICVRVERVGAVIALYFLTQSGSLGAVDVEGQVALLLVWTVVVEDHSVRAEAFLNDAIGARIVLVALRRVSEEAVRLGAFVRKEFVVVGRRRSRCLCP
jgi:hypothetical protein